MSCEACGNQTRPTASRNVFSEILYLLDFAQPSAFLLWSKVKDPKDSFQRRNGNTQYVPLCHLPGAYRLCIKCQIITKFLTISEAGEEKWLLAQQSKSKKTFRLTHPPTCGQLIQPAQRSSWSLQLFSQPLITNVNSQQQSFIGLHQHFAWLPDNWLSKHPVFCKSSDTSLLVWKLT